LIGACLTAQIIVEQRDMALIVAAVMDTPMRAVMRASVGVVRPRRHTLVQYRRGAELRAFLLALTPFVTDAAGNARSG
jgi:hypothetical protein